MRRLVLAAVVFAFTVSGCSLFRKATPIDAATPPLCVRYDTSEMLFTYGPALAREQTIQDFVRRLDRYLQADLQTRKVPVVTGVTCDPAAHRVLSIRFDTFQSTDVARFARWTREAQMRYSVRLSNPGSTALLLDFSDQRNEESLDDLARKIASKMGGWVRSRY